VVLPRRGRERETEGQGASEPVRPCALLATRAELVILLIRARFQGATHRRDLFFANLLRLSSSRQSLRMVADCTVMEHRDFFAAMTEVVGLLPRVGFGPYQIRRHG
jgi:hypothetical protein